MKQGYSYQGVSAWSDVLAALALIILVGFCLAIAAGLDK